jgi:hypothetical protein
MLYFNGKIVHSFEFHNFNGQRDTLRLPARNDDSIQ